VEEIIEKYTMFSGQDAQPQDFLPEDIMLNSTGTSDMYYIARSKFLSLRTPISNISGALTTRNILINEKGAIGMLVSDSKDSDGAIPLGSEERTRIEKEYRRKYGIADDQSKILISGSNLKWIPMSFPTKDLMLFEEVEDDLCTICGAYGMSRKIFPSSVAKATGWGFEDEEEAIKQTYQNTIQPEADELMEMFNTDPDFGLMQSGYRLCAGYDWLPALQGDAVLEETAEKLSAEGNNFNAQAIVLINTQVRNNVIDLETAVNILVELMELEPKVARKLITIVPPSDPTKPTDPNALT
jgi:Phage portal protein